jgi:hypothetical protein
LEAVAGLGAKSLAFPYGIGCGLAGGDWKVYETMLRDWAAAHPLINVVLYQWQK